MNRLRRPTTLAGRLALGGVAWIALWLMGLIVLFNILLITVLAGQVDTSLRARAEALGATVRYRDGRLTALPGQDDALDAGSSIYLGTTLFEGAPLGQELTDELVQRGRRMADHEGLTPARYLAEPITSGGRQVGTIVVGSATGDRTRTGWIVAGASAVLVLVTLAFTYTALRGTITRALRPVRGMGEQASAWSDADTDRRFDPHTGPVELRQLAANLNELLERISATLRHERQFTAELSHQLRTPLAHLHAEVDLLAEPGADDRPDVTLQDLDRLRTSVRRLEDLVEAALMPARARVPGSGGVVRAGDALAGVAPPHGAAAVVTVGDLDVLLAVDAEVVDRALQPVLENAGRYAVREIRIEVTADGPQTRIRVSDDGGRLRPDDASRVFDPGFRADPEDGHPGAGLGLALTRRICRAAGGDAEAFAEPGHTVIVLSFPRIER